MIRIAQICLFLLCLPVLLTALRCEGGEGDRCFLKKFNDGRIVRGAGESLLCSKKFSLERTDSEVIYSCTSSDFCNSGNLQKIVESAPNRDVCLLKVRAKRDDEPQTAEEPTATEATNEEVLQEETETPNVTEEPKKEDEPKKNEESKGLKKMTKAPVTTTMSPKRKEALRRGTESLQLGLMALFSAGMMIGSGLVTAVLVNHGMK